MDRIIAKLIGGPHDGTFWSTAADNQIITGLDSMNYEELASDNLPIERYVKTTATRDFTDLENLNSNFKTNNEIGIADFVYQS